MASVLVPLAAGCEELEAVTIIDLLRRAGVEVVSAGLAPGPVKASRGVVLLPDTDLDRALERDYDMIVLPGGGPGSEALARDARVQQALRRMAAAGKYTAAICAAPMALATAGLLENRRATSYPGSLDDIPVKGMTYLEESVVQDGKVITSRGPGTAMDFALHLVELLAGKEKRAQVEKGLVRP
jgi:4-methyl-5(b-hydroxyethyl)-thiazole monophosphate biosynthesis